MFYSARSRLFFRITSVVTLLFFFPVSVEAANLLPPVVEEEQQPADSSSALQLLDETRLAQLDSGASFSPLPEMKLASLRTEAKGSAENAASPEKLARRSEKPREVSAEQAVSTTDDAPEVLTDSALKTTPVASKADDALAASSATVSDMRLAKVLTVGQKASSSRLSSGVKVIRKAPVQTQSAVELTESETEVVATKTQSVDAGARMAQVKEAFSKGAYDVAVSGLVDVVDSPTAAVDVRHSADAQLQLVWREMRLGAFSETELDAIETQLTAKRAGQETAEGAHAAMKFFALRADLLEKHEKQGLATKGEAKAYYEETQVRAADVMKRFPTSPLMVDTMNEYLSSTRRMGREDLKDALSWCWEVYRDSEAPFALACAVEGVASNVMYRQLNARTEAWVMHGDMVTDANTEMFEDWVTDESIFPWVRAELLYASGMGRYEVGRWGEARDTFIRIVKEFAEAGDVTERAALAAAFIENRMYYEDYETCLKVYQDFLNTFPQSRYVARALWLMADLYWRAENVQTAYATYQQVMKLFPATRFADSAKRNCRFMEKYILDSDLGLAVPEEKPVLAPPVFAKLCGPEALHHYLALQGEAASVEELGTAAGLNDKGVSMQALLDTAAVHGHSLVGVEMAARFCAAIPGACG